MDKIVYQNIKDENELLDKINNLDKIASSYIIKTEELYIEDLFFMSIIDKSIKLIDSFIFAFNKRNITVLATLTRVQIDCVIRAYATTLVGNSNEFCTSVLINNKNINSYKDINGNKLTDKFLCESLSQYIHKPLYELYKKVCGFVHFSSDGFHNIAKTHNNCNISMYISRNNQKEDEKEYKRLSMELANQFLYFGSLLIENIYASWLEQKRSI